MVASLSPRVLQQLHKSFQLSLFCIIIGFVAIPRTTGAATPHIFISQIQIEGDQSSDDFVVIQNSEKCAVDLSDWKLRKRTASGSESSVRVFGNGSILPEGQVFIWASSANNFADTIKAHERSSAALAKDNAIALLDADNTIIDSLAWGAVQTPFRTDSETVENPGKNESISRVSANSSAIIEPTSIPEAADFAEENLALCGTSKDRAEHSNIVLSEILANPLEDEDRNEFIEIENQGETPIDLSKWTLSDASKSGKYVFPTGTSIGAGEFLLLRRSMFVFALNNTDETVTLEDAHGESSDSISWNASKENVSLARDGTHWRNTKLLTPGRMNAFDREPSARTELPRSGFAEIAIDFSASVRDPDRDPTKVVWDFGDGHRSYQKKTTHTYEKKGKYSATLRYTDGTSDIEKHFTVRIENYHAPKVRIVKIIPNPHGKDEGRESILIENRSKKSVDIKGWVIATKSRTKTKDFTNHAIRKSFVLKPGESRTLTSEYAAFTLGNTRQHIELRDPRKKTVQRIHYKLERSVPSGSEFYKLPNEPWQWKFPALLSPGIATGSNDKNSTKNLPSLSE